MGRKTGTNPPDVPAQAATTLNPTDNAPETSRSGTLQVVRQTGENDATAMVRTATSALVRGTATGREFGKTVFGTDIDPTAYMETLQHQADAMKAGNMAEIETMLLTQANTLDMAFNRLATQAIQNPLMQQMDTLLRLALKAQAQCRASLEALADIKNPRPVAFVKQANIAHGPQQVNNAPPTTYKPAPAGDDTLAHGKTGKSLKRTIRRQT
ncbi:hypothetical protein GCM10010971_16780 [Silvimonas amylolytica]|uniref:Phasin protein n=1 Tax=Silvimonas amylolytica TaxID=449663 RepID=A0ABQ2PLL8_9NEIS|nr:hypothetical protein GCM10010971_16780 [Silvimonas amylolytica]